MNIEEVSFDNFKDLSKEEQEMIFSNFSYLRQLVKKNLNEHRYAHSLSVAKTAFEIAKYNNVDPNRAYLAGLLHDVCKFPDSDTSGVLEAYLKKYEPSKLNGIVGAYHSWVAPYYLKEKTGYDDKEILSAIYNHTILEEVNPLNLIIYIADKREPLRNINDGILDLAKKDLSKAYMQLKGDVEEYLKSNGKEFVESLH